jgi:hypothetical protein
MMLVPAAKITIVAARRLLRINDRKASQGQHGH